MQSQHHIPGLAPVAGPEPVALGPAEEHGATPLAERLAEALASPEAFVETLARLADSAEGLLTLETSALFLVGAVAAAVGGRVIVAVMGVAFLVNLAVALGILPALPAWVAPALAAALTVGLVHLLLALLLGDQSAGTAMVMAFTALVTMLVLRPLALLRLPGLARLFRFARRR